MTSDIIDVWGSFPPAVSAILADNTNYRRLLALSLPQGYLALIHGIWIGPLDGEFTLDSIQRTIRVGFTEDPEMDTFEDFNDPRTYGKFFYIWRMSARRELVGTAGMTQHSQFGLTYQHMDPPKKIVGVYVNVVGRTGLVADMTSLIFGVRYTVRKASAAEQMTLFLRQKRFREDADLQRLAVGLI